MTDAYIWIGVWSVILIMLIVELGKVQSRLAEDRINKMFEYLKERRGENMRRYIDADIAVAQIAQLKDNDSSKYDLGLDTAINEIKHHMPIADVVEIVRCKNCRNWN